MPWPVPNNKIYGCAVLCSLAEYVWGRWCSHIRWMSFPRCSPYLRMLCFSAAHAGAAVAQPVAPDPAPLPSAEVLRAATPDSAFEIIPSGVRTCMACAMAFLTSFFSLLPFHGFYVVMLNVMTNIVRPRHHRMLLPSATFIYLSPDVSLHRHRSLERTCDNLINAMAKTKWRSNWMLCALLKCSSRWCRPSDGDVPTVADHVG
jgi:hypothetical protein